MSATGVLSSATPQQAKRSRPGIRCAAHYSPLRRALAPQHAECVVAEFRLASPQQPPVRGVDVRQNSSDVAVSSTLSSGRGTRSNPDTTVFLHLTEYDSFSSVFVLDAPLSRGLAVCEFWGVRARLDRSRAGVVCERGTGGRSAPFFINSNPNLSFQDNRRGQPTGYPHEKGLTRKTG